MQPSSASPQGRAGLQGFRLTFLVSNTVSGVYQASDGQREYLLMDRYSFDQVLKALDAAQSQEAGVFSIPAFEGIEIIDDVEVVGAIVARCLLVASQPAG